MGQRFSFLIRISSGLMTQLYNSVSLKKQPLFTLTSFYR